MPSHMEGLDGTLSHHKEGHGGSTMSSHMEGLGGTLSHHKEGHGGGTMSSHMEGQCPSQGGT